LYHIAAWHEFAKPTKGTTMSEHSPSPPKTPRVDCMTSWMIGRLEGLDEGRRESTLEAKRDAMLTALRVRFRRDVPRETILALLQLNDFKELARWFEAALLVNSLDAFHAAIGFTRPYETPSER
jgi:hypothetical protein